MGEDIRYIKSSLPKENFGWIHRKPAFPFLLVFPVAGLLGAGLFRWRKALHERNPEKRRFAAAYRKMKKTMAQIAAHASEMKPEEVSERIFDAVQNYFADKMTQPPSGLTVRMIEEFLEKNQIPMDEIAETKNLWQELEFVRYAPSQFRTGDLDRLRNSFLRLAESIEGKLRKSGSFVKRAVWCAVLSLGSSLIFSDSPAEQFERANSLYKEGRFQNAYQLYIDIERGGLENAALEYNLGNASYKLSRPGEALAHWIRAWRMNPRDPDLMFNLQWVSSQTGDPFFPEIFFMRWMKIFYRILDLNELSILLLLVLWGISFYGCWILIRQDVPDSGKLFAGAMLLAAIAFWWSARWRDEQLKTWGVIAVQKAEVRSGPGLQFGVGFTAPEGRRLLILEENPNSDWAEIGIPREGMRGWIEKVQIIKI